MQVIIMAGGEYYDFKTPKQLSIINGEPLIVRTIRLLKERNVEEIYISATSSKFDNLGVPRLEHKNSFRAKDGIVSGYWVDAYYPTDKPTIYLHGDVYYTEDAIDKILNYEAKVNTFIGNAIALNKQHKNWGEPFGWIVVNQKQFRKAIEDTKKLQDEGRLERGYAISWELYRVQNGTDPNKMFIDESNYLVIDDDTIDIDNEWQIEILNNKLKEK